LVAKIFVQNIIGELAGSVGEVGEGGFTVFLGGEILKGENGFLVGLFLVTAHEQL
jgi:hypothetical protein